MNHFFSFLVLSFLTTCSANDNTTLDRIEALENSTENQDQRIEKLNEKLFNF